MKFKAVAPRRLAVAAVGLLATGASSARNVTVTVFGMKDVLNVRARGAPLRRRLRTMSSTSGAPASPVSAASGQNWRVDTRCHCGPSVQAARDGLHHVGAMVGTSPFEHQETSRIPVVIVPLMLRTHTLDA